MKEPEHYAKLVFAGRWKKVQKLMESGETGEKVYIMEALGSSAKSSDEGYNHLVEAVQKTSTSDKEVLLKGIEALGACGRSQAASQLDFIREHNEDPEIKEAALAAIHALKH